MDNVQCTMDNVCDFGSFEKVAHAQGRRATQPSKH